MSTYLSFFPKPFLEELVASRCIPFVGAGFSKNATLPANSEMPDWEQLGRLLASELPGHQYFNAIEAVSAYIQEYSRVNLVERLAQALLVERAKPGATHRAFCELPFTLVVTTNFDFLLERGYSLAGRYCRPVVGEDQLSIQDAPTSVRVLKLHGDLHHPSRLVMSEDDYDAFLARNPLLATFVGSALIEKTALFVGYSLDDPDFRQVWQVIKDRLGVLRRPAYVLQVDAPQHLVTRFERRGVKVVNLPGPPKNYPHILREVFDELREYWLATLLERSSANEEESAVELSLPPEAESRLCFFAVPVRWASFYKRVLYPVAERHGFTPIMAIDVLSPGDAIFAKVVALLERARLVVVDTSSPSTTIELGVALSDRPPEELFVITEPGAELPLSIADIRHFRRPTDPEKAEEELRPVAERWFRDAATRFGAFVISLRCAPAQKQRARLSACLV